MTDTEKKEEKKQEGIIWHDANKEMPEFYPEKLIPAEIEDKKGVLLDQCHSKYYIPTEEAKMALQKKLKKYGHWAYVMNQRGSR